MRSAAQWLTWSFGESIPYFAVGSLEAPDLPGRSAARGPVHHIIRLLMGNSESLNIECGAPVRLFAPILPVQLFGSMRIDALQFRSPLHFDRFPLSSQALQLAIARRLRRHSNVTSENMSDSKRPCFDHFGSNRQGPSRTPLPIAAYLPSVFRKQGIGIRIENVITDAKAQGPPPGRVQRASAAIFPRMYDPISSKPSANPSIQVSS